MTRTALPITSAGRFWPFGRFGTRIRWQGDRAVPSDQNFKLRHYPVLAGLAKHFGMFQRDTPTAQAFEIKINLGDVPDED